MQASAQDQTPPTSRGENFSAKPAAALFASDCTGAGCHKGPQGLGKNMGLGSLAGFLREHYTNSRESAAALASYLSKIPSGPDPKEARKPGAGKPTAAAPASGSPGWAEGLGFPPASKPAPNEARAPRQTPIGQNPAGRTSRAAVKPDEDPAAAPAAAASAGPHPPADVPDPGQKPGEAGAKPSESPKPNPAARVPRGRQPATAAVAAPPQPVPEAAPAPSPLPAPPAPKQYDIFD